MAGWIALGTAIRAYERSLQHVKTRKQFGKPLAGFQLIQLRLVQMLANLEAMYAHTRILLSLLVCVIILRVCAKKIFSCVCFCSLVFLL